MPLTSGAGSISGTVQSIKQNVASTFRSKALIYFVLSTSASVAEWQYDQESDGYDLAGIISANIIKAVIISAAVTLMAAALFTTLATVATLLGSVIAIPAIMIGLIYIVLAVLAGIIVEKIDKFLTSGRGLAKFIGDILRSVGTWVKDVLSRVEENSSNNFYDGLHYGF